jgi:RNA polymerase sigma-70 factor, ECF subfamily
VDVLVGLAARQEDTARPSWCGEADVLEGRERAALQQLARDELPGLYAFARHLDADDAEDLVQETLLRACRSFGTLRDRAAGGRWLRTILANVWRDRLRKDQREPEEVPVDDHEPSLYRRIAEEDPSPYSDTLHVDFLGAFSEADVHQVLQRLPTRYRIPLVLRYVQGFSATETAEILELPCGTVFSQLHRGRERFEAEMWRYAEESGLVPPASFATSGSPAHEDGRWT